MEKKKVSMEKKKVRTTTDLVLRETRVIVDSDALLKKDPDEMTAEQLLTAWSVLSLLKSSILDPREGALRGKLLALAKEKGKDNGKGSFKVFFTEDDEVDGSFMNQKRKGRVTYDIEALRSILAKKGISDRELIVPKDFKVNEEGVSRLIRDKMLSAADVEKFTKVAPDVEVLRVEKPSIVQSLFPALPEVGSDG